MASPVPALSSHVPRRRFGRRRPARLRLLVVLLTLTGSLAALSAPALADHSQVAILQDDSLLLRFPGYVLGQARNLGISTTRVGVRWLALAPEPNSFRKPRHFNAASPGAYAQYKWAKYDAVVRTASRLGIRVEMDLLGGGPLWATGSQMPTGIRGYPFHNWKPSAVAFGKFARAVAIRYSGNYNPGTRRLDPGNSHDLPRVNFWSVWNEPNYGPSLAPQAVPHSANTPYSPRIYRAMVDQTWDALHATGHRSDTLLFGELAPRGELGPGRFNMMVPLLFMRALYCVSGSYHPLRGASAAIVGCPTSARGSRAFAARNPALFHAAGVSDHPYMRWYPPNKELNQSQPAGFRRLKPNYATLATIGNLERGLNRMLSAYGSHRKLPIWMTEFAYITNPPDRPSRHARWHYPSGPVAAYYDNWAEYIAWRDSRIASFDQYVLQDPPKPRGRTHHGFPSGLLYANGHQKPGYAAFRMPFYMPRTTASDPSVSLEVWGGARPIHFELMDQPSTPETVTVLFQQTGADKYLPLATEQVTSPQGYFDARLNFPASGHVKLGYTYPDGSLLGPPGTTIYSRTISVKVH